MKELTVSYNGSSFDELNAQTVPSLIERVGHRERGDLDVCLREIKEYSSWNTNTPRQVTLVLVNLQDLGITDDSTFHELAAIIHAGYRLGLRECSWFVPFLICRGGNITPGLHELFSEAKQKNIAYGDCLLVLKPASDPVFSLPRYSNFWDPVRPDSGWLGFTFWFKTEETQVSACQMIGDTSGQWTHFLFERR